MKINSILVTLPEPINVNSPYNRLKNKYNLKIHFRPFTHVEAINAKKVRLQKIDLSNFQNIILTSRNAVDHFFRISNEMRFKVPDSTKYFCQSEAVAFYLQKYVVYRKRKIYVGKKSINDLEQIFEKFNDETYLLPTSDKLKSDIPEFLNKIELNWKRIQLYKTVVAAYGKSTIEAVNKANLTANIEAPTNETPSMTMAIEKFLENINL